MPLIADTAQFQNRKAGGALENAAEEILNGIFCHYEPPTSTKAQKTAAEAVRKNPTKFLYEEQPTKPLLTKKVITTPRSDRDYESASEYETDADTQEYEQEDEGTLEDEEISLLKVQAPETPSKRGIKWRDEESKRIEEEREKAKAASSWSQCITLPCFTADGQDIPGTLEDIHDENEMPQEPTPLGAATPTKSALKKRDDGVMKVLYDDQGNPNTTPKSPGSIKNHAFFRNVTNSPRATNARAQFYEPKDYNKPSTPKDTAFTMPRDFTPRPKQYPASPSNVGAPSPRALASPAEATVQLPAPPTPMMAKQVDIPPSPMQVSQIPGSPGVSDYQFNADEVVAPPQRIRQIGPLPGSPGIKDQRGGPDVIRLAKIGRNPTSPKPLASVAAAAAAAANRQTWSGVDPAMAQTGNYVAKSPRSYMAPVAPPKPSVIAAQENADIETPAQISVMDAVQMLNKAGFNPGKKFNRGFNAKSFKIKAPPKSPSAQQQHLQNTNENRDSLEEQKPSFVGTRRVSAPASSVPSSGNSALLKEIRHSARPSAPSLELNTDFDELEMARDPTPRQMKIQELEDNLRAKGPLPPTPRRKKEEPEYTTRPTPTAQKPPQHFVPTNNSGSEKTIPKESYEPVRNKALSKSKTEKESQPKKKTEKKKQEKKNVALAPSSSSRPSSKSRSTNNAQNKNKKKEKKGFMSGLKKGLGKLKNAVDEIDSQRIPEASAKKKTGSRREVRMA